MTRLVIIFSVMLTGMASQAQEFLGVRSSNYAGVQSVFLNPSSLATSKMPWDVNVVSQGILFDNTFFFVPKGNLPFFGFNRLVNGIVHEDLFYNHYDPHNPNKLYQFALSDETIGPSFFTNIGKGQQFGLTIAARGYLNSWDIPGHVLQNAYTDFQDKSLWKTPWNDNSTTMNSASWVEYGLHYSRTLSDHPSYGWKIGFSFKFLQGLLAAYTNNTNLHYTVVDSSKVIVTHSSLDYAGTRYYPSGSPGDLTHGFGLSGDVGLTYLIYHNPEVVKSSEEHFTEGGHPSRSYKLRLGVSLLDLGGIHYARSSSTFHYSTDSTVYDHLGNGPEGRLNRSLSDLAGRDDSLKVLTGNSFVMRLPSAISFQADWNVYGHFYLNATIIKGFGLAQHTGIVRPDVYSLTPRYETELLEISLPFSLLYYNHLQPRMGLAFRIGYFFFGGDAPWGMAGLNNFERADLYAGIHFFPFQKKTKSSDCPQP